MNESTSSQTNFRSALIVLTTLFFMWGFITCMNDILIPYLKKMFGLTRAASMDVQFYFFMAYFIGSVIYFVISYYKTDPINKIGYKNGILIGLFVSATGCLTFYPAAELKSYGLFLVALFIVGFGFTMLQIAANPYVAILGKPESASSRLNLSQAFNSFGTAIAPIIGGYLVFHYFAIIGKPFIDNFGNPILSEGGQPITALGVQLPYLFFAGIFILLAVLILITKLPQFTNKEDIVKGLGALQYRHLIFGMISIFVYVGAEVSIGSCLINYMGELVNFTEIKSKSFLAFYWGGAMIGRFLGAISLSEMKNKLKKYSLMFITSICAFIVIYMVILIENPSDFKISVIAPYFIFLIINYVAFIFGKSLPGRTLLIFALINVILLLITMITGGMISIWSLLGVGLFNSIMWSNIFTLAIKDLGKYTSQGSSLLIMMILGGSLIPKLQGFIADALDGYHYAFFVPIICYIYLAYYGWKGHVVKKIR